jgi:hypothetical protein
MKLAALILAAAFMVLPAQPGSGGICAGGIGRHAAAFSPDGSILAVILAEGICPRWTVAISRRGGPVTPLGSNDSAAGLSWSPDGQHFVAGLFSTRKPLVVYDAEGGVPKTIAEGINPAWSPDGRSIAYADVRDGIHVVAPDGTNDRRIAAGDRAAWSSDSSSLAYDRQGSIFVAAAEGSGERRLTAGESPSWSPDGAWLGVVREGSAHLIRPDGSGERPIGPGEHIQWSSSGDEVALLDSVGVLRLVSLTNGQTRRVAEDVETAAISPRWDAIATVLNVGRRSEVYVAEATGARPARVTASQCNLYSAHCVQGTDRADRIIGTAERDVVFPGAGDDRVWGRGGDDRIDTAYGRDFVDAGPGNDIVVTHGNDDRIDGGLGIDHLYPGNGEDLVNGGAGQDFIYAGYDGRRDFIRCGPGRDTAIVDQLDRVAVDCETVRSAPA